MSGVTFKCAQNDLFTEWLNYYFQLPPNYLKLPTTYPLIMKGLNSSIIILSYDLKNMLYIGSACMENGIAEHPVVVAVVVTFLRIPWEIKKVPDWVINFGWKKVHNWVKKRVTLEASHFTLPKILFSWTRIRMVITFGDDIKEWYTHLHNNSISEGIITTVTLTCISYFYQFYPCVVCHLLYSNQ